MVKHIEFRGKRYPFRYSYLASKGVVAELGREFDGEAKTFDFEGAEVLFYHCIKSGCAHTGEEFTLKKEDIPLLMDELGIEKIGGLFAAFRPPPKRGRPPKE